MSQQARQQQLATDGARHSARYSVQRYIDREIRMESVIHFTHLPLSSYLFIGPLLSFQRLSASLSGVTVSERDKPQYLRTHKVKGQANIRVTALKDRVQGKSRQGAIKDMCVYLNSNVTIMQAHNPLLSIRKQGKDRELHERQKKKNLHYAPWWVHL